MDDFKRKQMENIGPGGFGCPCCNDFFGKNKNSRKRNKRLLNKISRRKLKREIHDKRG